MPIQGNEKLLTTFIASLIALVNSNIGIFSEEQVQELAPILTTALVPVVTWLTANTQKETPNA